MTRSCERCRPLELQLQNRWQSKCKRFVRAYERGPFFVGVAAGGSEKELFLADIANGVVRAFDVRSGQLNARDVYRCPPDESVASVAYSAHTDTLFVCSAGSTNVQNAHGWYIVRSFARTYADCEWRERYRFGSSSDSRWYFLRVLSDGRLVLADRYGLQLLQVDNKLEIRSRGYIRLPSEAAEFDAKLAGGELWLAAAVETPAERRVALFRVAGDVAEELSRCPLREPRQPLFWRDSLLVFAHTADVVGGWEVHEFGTGGGRFEPRRVVLSGRNINYGYTPEWCLVNGALVAWNLEHGSLTTYSIL